MVFGNMHTLKIAVSNGNTAEQDIDDIVSSKKLLKFVSTQDVYLVLTPKSNSDNADANDYLIKANKEYEFLIGRALDRIALYNTSGSDANVHVAIMY